MVLVHRPHDDEDRNRLLGLLHLQSTPRKAEIVKWGYNWRTPSGTRDIAATILLALILVVCALTISGFTDTLQIIYVRADLCKGRNETLGSNLVTMRTITRESSQDDFVLYHEVRKFARARAIMPFALSSILLLCLLINLGLSSTDRNMGTRVLTAALLLALFQFVLIPALIWRLSDESMLLNATKEDIEEQGHRDPDFESDKYGHSNAGPDEVGQESTQSTLSTTAPIRRGDSIDSDFLSEPGVSEVSAPTRCSASTSKSNGSKIPSSRSYRSRWKLQNHDRTMSEGSLSEVVEAALAATKAARLAAET